MSESNDSDKYLDPDYDPETDQDYDPEKDPLYQRSLRMMEHYPVIHKITQVLCSHNRIRFFRRNQVPALVEAETMNLVKHLDRLSEMVPVNTLRKDEVPRHTLAYTLAVLCGEIDAVRKNDADGDSA